MNVGVTRLSHLLAISIGLLTPQPAGLQAQGTSASSVPIRTWAAPRTPWGHPDLQGIWSNATTTPLERQTAQEQEQARLAEAPVRAATQGTGAGFRDTGEPLEQPSLVVDPPDGRMRMTSAAVERLLARELARRDRGESDSWLDRNSWERCISRGMPTAMIPNLYNNYYQIFQTPTHVAILIEMIHDVRIIPLDRRPHISSDIRQWFGDPRGQWEGDTLIVETVNFVDRMDGGELQPSHVIQTGYRGSGKTLRLVERFTRTGPASIDYRFTVEDPETFVRPYTVAIPMRKDNSQERIPEYACHEGNYSMLNLLTGGRANEKRAVDAAALVRRQRIQAGHPGVREPAVPFISMERAKKEAAR